MGKIFLFFLLIIGLVACDRNNHPEVLLKEEIKLALEDNNGISHKEYLAIKSLILEDQQLSSSYPNADAIRQLIEFVGLEMSKDEAKPINIPLVIEDDIFVEENEKNAIHFFYENSVSMDGYLNGNTAFTEFVLGILSTADLKKDKISLYYINRDAFPVSRNVVREYQDFLSPANVMSYGKSGRGNSEINRILGVVVDTILTNGNDKKVGIVVSDYIYSIQGEDVSKQLNFQKATTISNLKKLAGKKYAILIVKIESDFNGMYFDMTNHGTSIQEKRPFFVWVIGDKERILSFVKRYDVNNTKKYAGYREHLLLFDGELSSKPYFSVLMDTEKKGRFTPSERGRKEITFIEDVKLSRENEWQISVAVDLSGVPEGTQYLMDTAHYQVISSAGDPIAVSSIQPITSELLNPNDKDQRGSATHFLILKSNRITENQDVRILLRKKVPEWINTSSSNSDISYTGRFGKTFGLSYLVNAAAEVFNYNEQSYYFSLQIKVK